MLESGRIIFEKEKRRQYKANHAEFIMNLRKHKGKMKMTLYEIYQTQVFDCKQCKRVNPAAVNAYSERNPRCDEKAEMWLGRRSYLKDYLDEKINPTVMIVGQSPGFLGCGYTGIPFTAEQQAISDLRIKNYHLTAGKRMNEQSAELIYGILRDVAGKKGIDVAELSKRIVMTNCFQCIPADSNGEKLCISNGVKRAMSRQCMGVLKAQIETMKPQCIISLGEDALRELCALLKINKPNRKMADLILEKASWQIGPKAVLYPLLHPSPLARSNEAFGVSKRRLAEIIERYT